MADQKKEQPENPFSEVASLVAERVKGTRENGNPQNLQKSAGVFATNAMEEENARIQAAEEKSRREQAIKTQQAEQEKKRLQAVEQKAHQEGFAKLEEFRHHAEQDAYAKEPIPWFLTLVLAFFLSAGGVALTYMVKSTQNHQIVTTKTEQDQELASIEAQNLKQIEDNKNKYKSEISSKEEQIAKLQKELEAKQKEIASLQAQKEAKDKADALAAQVAAEKLKKQQAFWDQRYEQKKADEIKRKQHMKETDRKMKKCRDSDDPLCGF